MSKITNMEEAFKLGSNIETYFETWESVRIDSDPLIDEWRKYIEKKSEKTSIGIVTHRKKKPAH